MGTTNGDTKVKSPPKSQKHQAKPTHKSPQQAQLKSTPSYKGQPKVRIELSPVCIHGCSATEFLAWVRQQEGEIRYAK